MKIEINNYKSYTGFFDLRNFKLSKRLFRRLWRIQDTLYEMTKNQEYYKKWHPEQWEKAKELSAYYQSLLLKHAPNQPLHVDRQGRAAKQMTLDLLPACQ